MSIVTLQCETCGAKFERRLVLWLRSGPHAFCDRECFGLSRRKDKSLKARKAEKAAYDRIYRARNLRRIRRRKAAYFAATYDPEKARLERKKIMPRHIEYCRRPEYRRYKHAYDIKYNAKRNYGEFGEAFILLKKIETEVGKRMSDYEIRMQQGTLNKTQKRKGFQRKLSSSPRSKRPRIAMQYLTQLAIISASMTFGCIVGAQLRACRCKVLHKRLVLERQQHAADMAAAKVNSYNVGLAQGMKMARVAINRN